MARRLPPMLPRYLVQAGFLALYVWIFVHFVRWVGALQSGRMPPVARPAAVDGFLPISGLMGLRHWWQAGELYPVHPAAALILLAALLSGLFLKRGFCSWICPVFPLSEGLWRGGQKAFGRTFAPPFWLDLPLRSLKYLILFFFLYQIAWAMPLPGLRAFLASPYHKIADVRLLQFFEHPSAIALGVIAVLAVACVFVQMAWCRYLCPYGALLGLVSLLSPTKISRDERICIRCGLCSKRCPAWLPVMQLRTVRSCECYGCFRCVHNCPAPGAVEMRLLRRLIVPSAVFGVVLVLLFAAADIYGRATGRWHSQTPLWEIASYLRGSP